MAPGPLLPEYELNKRPSRSPGRFTENLGSLPKPFDHTNPWNRHSTVSTPGKGPSNYFDYDQWTGQAGGTPVVPTPAGKLADSSTKCIDLKGLEGRRPSISSAFPPFDNRGGTSKYFEYNDPWNRQSTVSLAVPPLVPGGGSKYYEGTNPRDSKLVQLPAATANTILFEVLDLRGFMNLDLWKFAVLECIASMINTFLTSWVALHPPAALESPKTEAGIYHTSTFFSPLFTGLTMTFLVPLLIYTLAPTSGGHINPTLTMAMFFTRMISFPQTVLYLVGQTFGGALGGFAIHNAYGSRDFTVGGCSVNTAVVPEKDALVIEFMGCLTLIYIAFGVALDPRHGKLFSHASSPWFIGIILGLVTWASAFTREGYAGASLNPARCFGSYVASTFPGYHWIHWFGPLAASLVHAVMYYLGPLWVDPRAQS